MKAYKIAKVIKRELLPVSGLHSIYVEQSGNPKGLPIIHIHGGPGSRSKPKHRKLFNPRKYRIIQFDQRGCGKSTPRGEIKQNTTQDTISDIEKIRNHLGIDKWVVFGRSWGSTLALYYAEKHPGRVLYLIVGGIFTHTKFEADWLFQEGANYFFPDKFEEYKNFIPKAERNNLSKAYVKRILGENKKLQRKSAAMTDKWERSIMSLRPTKSKEDEGEISENDLTYAKILFHYWQNNSFLKEGEILSNAHKLKNILGVIIQGRYDMVCPPITAWKLHKAWPKSEFVWVENAGHAFKTDSLQGRIVEHTDKMLKLLA